MEEAAPEAEDAASEALLAADEAAPLAEPAAPVMVLVKANKDTEAGVMPSEELLTQMGNYNEELVKAGVMLAGEGLHPTAKGARVKFSGTKRTVIDGPFTETKEVLGGFYLIILADIVLTSFVELSGAQTLANNYDPTSALIIFA